MASALRALVAATCLSAVLPGCGVGTPGAEQAPQQRPAGGPAAGPPDRFRPPGPDRRDPGDGPGEGRRSLTDAERSEIARRCAEPPRLPKGDDLYGGLLHDAHVHTSLDHDQAAFALAMLDEMNASGIGQALVQVDHSPGMNQHAGLKAGLREVEALWGDLAQLCDRFRVLIYAFDPDDPAEWDYVAGRLATGRYAGVGELEFRHSRLPLQHDPDSPLMRRLLPALDDADMLLHFQASRGPGTEQLPERMVALAAEHPTMPFLWFACERRPQEVWPDNVRCNTVLTSQMSSASGLSGSTWGSDMGPAGFRSPGWGVLPYQSIAEAATQARRLLKWVDPAEADRMAHGYFEAALGARGPAPIAAP